MTEPLTIPAPEEVLRILSPRVGAAWFRLRLEAESRGGRPLAGRSSAFAYLEEFMLGPRLLESLLSIAGLYERGRENALAIRLNRHDLASARLPGPLHGFRVLHLSDLHIDASPELEQSLHDRLAGAEFDLCVITGDLRYRDFGDAGPALRAMRRLRPVLGERALLVLGNHDSVLWVPYLEASGYEVLLNESAVVSHGGADLHVAGVDDRGYFAADDLRSAGRRIPAGSAALLLSHSPEIVRDDLVSRYDFVLCGHTHGGQINLPGGVPVFTNARCPRRFCSGSWSLGKVRGYTSAGSGSSLVEVRFNCPPEVTVHRLLGRGGRAPGDEAGPD